MLAVSCLLLVQTNRWMDSGNSFTLSELTGTVDFRNPGSVILIIPFPVTSQRTL